MLEKLERLKLEDGRELRLLSALEVLEARREAEGLARGEAEAALCANACLLARALERGGQPVFADGGAALAGLSAREIGALAGRWAAFDRAENPSPEDGEERLEGLKKAWSTRPMSAFAGVCSNALARFRRRSGPNRGRRGTISGAPSTWRWTGRRSWHGCVPPADGRRRRSGARPAARSGQRRRRGRTRPLTRRGLNA